MRRAHSGPEWAKRVRENAFGNNRFRRNRGTRGRAHIDEETARPRVRSLLIKEKDFCRSTPHSYLGTGGILRRRF